MAQPAQLIIEMEWGKQKKHRNQILPQFFWIFFLIQLSDEFGSRAEPDKIGT